MRFEVSETLSLCYEISITKREVESMRRTARREAEKEVKRQVDECDGREWLLEDIDTEEDLEEEYFQSAFEDYLERNKDKREHVSTEETGEINFFDMPDPCGNKNTSYTIP
jgi:hypothetical protein